MKKFLSLLLAAMMLLSCTTAMADPIDTINNGGNTAWFETDDNPTGDDGDADIDVSVSTTYGDDTLFDTEGEMATEIWLQVDATGQIEATVPLVLVFQTNIDGGEAVSPNTYNIVNHSTADLVVTGLKTTLVAAKADTDPSNQPMTMVAYSTTPSEDQYAVQLTVGKVGDATTGTDAVMGSGETSRSYDMYALTTEKTKAAHMGGLFELAKAPKDNTATGTTTNMSVDMKTGKLSFVTSRKDVAGTETDEMDITKGIQLMTITYTVAIDTSDAIGEAITTEGTKTTSPLSGADDATGEHTKIVEKTESGAIKDTADQ